LLSLKKSAIIMASLTLIIVAFSSLTMASKSNQPINISFTAFPSNAYANISANPTIAWRNTDVKPIQGSFDITVSCKKINVNSVTILFQGQEISSLRSGNSLTFFLPSQTFEAGKSGLVSFTVLYHDVGAYSWSIVVRQISK
jgi:hypothetical protein